MANQTIYLQGLAYWCPESAGTADIDTKPSSYTLTLGEIDRETPIEINQQTEFEDVFAAGTDAARRSARVAVKHSASISLTIAAINRRTWELILKATLAGETGDQNFVPDETLAHYGWLKLQGYYRSGEKFLLERFGSAEVQGAIQISRNIIKPRLVIECLHSTAQAGTIKSIG